MTAAALATTRLRIGSGISLVVRREPIVCAKTVASIDQLSGGRVGILARQLEAAVAEVHGE